MPTRCMRPCCVLCLPTLCRPRLASPFLKRRRVLNDAFGVGSEHALARPVLSRHGIHQHFVNFLKGPAKLGGSPPTTWTKPDSRQVSRLDSLPDHQVLARHHGLHLHVPLDKQQTPPPSHHRHDLGARVSRCCDQLSCNRLCAQLLGTGSPRALEVGRRREARPHFSLRRY